MLFPFLKSLSGPRHPGLPQLPQRWFLSGWVTKKRSPRKCQCHSVPFATHIPAEPSWILPPKSSGDVFSPPRHCLAPICPETPSSCGIRMELVLSSCSRGDFTRKIMGKSNFRHQSCERNAEHTTGVAGRSWSRLGLAHVTLTSLIQAQGKAGSDVPTCGKWKHPEKHSIVCFWCKSPGFGLLSWFWSCVPTSQRESSPGGKGWGAQRGEKFPFGMAIPVPIS